MAKLNRNPDDFDLGILLVHGIGSQASGETLVQWGDALIKVIPRATEKKVKVIAHHALKNDDGPAEMIVHIRTEDGTVEKWLITEGRWADSFLPPNYAELVSWSMRAIPWTLTLHTAQRYWLRSQNKSWYMRTYALIRVLVELLISLALAPLSMLLMLVALLLGLLPIPQLRSLILSGQTTLQRSVGDSLAFVESPARASLIKTRLLERLHALNERCAKTVVMAHSQGAAVVLDALGGIPEPLYSAQAPYFNELPAEFAMPDTLITFGAGTNQLASLKVLSSGTFMKLGMNPTIYGLIAFLGAWATFFYLRAIDTPYIQILYAGGTVVLLGTFLFLIQFPVMMVRKLYQRIKLSEKKAEALAMYTVVPIVPIGYMVLLFNTAIGDIPFSSFLLLVCITILVFAIRYILSDDIRSRISITRKPPGLERWIDIYASADPVSNGPTNMALHSETPVFAKVWNFGAVLYDHTAYWQNVDGFVLRAVRACAETAGSPWTAYLPGNQEEVDLRSQYRTFWLRNFGRLIVAAWILIGLSIWFSHRALIPAPHILPDWMKISLDGIVRFSLLALVILIMMWGTYNVVRFFWLVWVRSEQEKLLAKVAPEKHSETLPFVGMIMVLGVVFILGFVVLTKDTEGLRAIRFSLENAQEFLVILTAYSFFGYTVCSIVKRRPWTR